MVILNPCCCISLQRGSKTVAVVDIILAIIPVIVFIASYVPGVYGTGGQPFTDFNTGIWTIFIVFLTADIGLSVLLFYSAKERCIKNMQRWFYIRLLTTGAMILLIIVSSCFQVSAEFILYDVFYTLYRIFTLWVVYLYIGELVHEDTFYPRKQPHPDFSVAVISNSRNGNKGHLPSSYDYQYDTGNRHGATNGAYVS